jgi:hypothetical protein
MTSDEIKKLSDIHVSIRVLVTRVSLISQDVEWLLTCLRNRGSNVSDKFQFPEFIYGLLVGAGFIFLLAAAAWPHH